MTVYGSDAVFEDDFRDSRTYRQNKNGSFLTVDAVTTPEMRTAMEMNVATSTCTHMSWSDLSFKERYTPIERTGPPGRRR